MACIRRWTCWLRWRWCPVERYIIDIDAVFLAKVADGIGEGHVGIVEGVDITVSNDATLTLADSSVINLFQRNMFAVRAEIEIGFRADLDVFNALTATTASA